MIVDTVNCYAMAASGGAPAGITIAVKEVITGSSTGAQSFTHSDLTGITPAAALHIGSQHAISNDSTETSVSAQMSIAALGPSSVCNVMSLARAFGASTAACRSNSNTTYTHLLLNTSFSSNDERANGSLIDGGVSLDFDTNDATSRRAYFMAFGGANVSAKVDTVDLGTGTSPIVINSIGFQPDAVIFFGNYSAFSGSTSVGASLFFGMATPAAQYCVAQACPEASPPSQVMALLTNRCAMQLTNAGANSYDVTAGSFTSSGFSVTPSASAGNDRLGYLALKFDGGNCKLVPFTTPTNTGAAAITGAGFRPRAAIIVLTNLESTDPSFPISTSDLMSGLSISCLTESDQAATSMRNDSGSHGYGSKSKMTALLGASATSTYAIEATLTSFDSDGMTLNYSAVAAAGKKGFILFVE